MISTNYKQIVEDFDTINKVKVQGTKVTVTGYFNCREVEFEYFYKHAKVASAVKKLVQQFKGL